MPNVAILLVPGFFGYSAFGPDEHPILEYFGGVRAVLQPLFPESFIVAHEPPPTGSIASRVASLHEAVGKLLRGDLLPHGGRPFKADRVHLVGHSTGGVDARLFTNRAFSLGSAKLDGERDAALAFLGNVVTLAAPFHGTPLATNITNDNDLLLLGVRLLTMLGVFTHGDLVRLGLELAKTSPGALLEHAVALPRSILASLVPSHFADALLPLLFPRRRDAHKHAAALLTDVARQGQVPSVSAEVASQVSAFFSNIEAHHELLPDLTVASMTRRTEGIEPADYGSRPGDNGRIFSYATVSPAPVRGLLADLDGVRHLDLVQRFIYTTLYDATTEPPAVSAAPPDGPEFGVGARTLAAQASANDGVVSTRSQTVAGQATGIVLGDHLDVVGSFDGGSGANVMRSGADFTGARFEALWNDIARHLA